MIKKIIGIILSLAVLAIMVFAVLGAGTYKSMLPEGFWDGFTTEQTAQSNMQ